MKMQTTRRAWLSAMPMWATGERPLFSFGALADIQYADKPDAGPRRYRASLGKVARWREAIRDERLEFVVHLGDLIDEREESIAPALAAARSLHPRLRHVLGNHDYSVPRETILSRLGLPRSYYDFTVRGWRFIVLDGMEVAATSVQGRSRLVQLQQEGARNAQEWNGAMSAEQLAWLERTLADAARRGQRAIVFGHFPLLPEGCRPDHTPWDWQEVLEILDASPAAAAYFNGHDHRGGAGWRGGIPFVTLKGLVEHEPGAAGRMVDVYRDRLVVRGGGEQVVLPLRAKQAAAGWQPLSGWEIECRPEDRDKKFWRWADGAAACDSLGRKDHDYVWLMARGEFGDFEWEGEVKGFAGSPGNSGVQFRSRYDREAGWLDGPQFDVHPPDPFRTGLIYDETREVRRWIHPSLPDWRITREQAPHPFHWNARGWNRLRLVCRGTRVETWLNGLPVTSFNGRGVLDDAEHRRRGAGMRGRFALQLHSRDELKIEYRSLRVREIRNGEGS